jgi:hypothetical protein
MARTKKPAQEASQQPVSDLIARTLTLRSELDAHPEGAEHERSYQRLLNAWLKATLAVGAAPANTLADVQAKARFLMDQDKHDRQGSAVGASFNRAPAEQAALLMLKQLAGRTQADPDAEYIALCNEVIEAEKQADRVLDLMDDHSDHEWRAIEKDQLDPIRAKSSAAFDRLLSMKPATAEGRRAAAQATLAFTTYGRVGEPPQIQMDHVGEGLAWRLVEMLAAGAEFGEAR